MQDAKKENNYYERYTKLSGIINEKDYDSALIRAKSATTLDALFIEQAEFIARIAGIELYNSNDVIDRRIILYGILRADTAPKNVKYHHSQMSDQRLFAEVLRMLGDVDSLNKLINSHPHIAFK